MTEFEQRIYNVVKNIKRGQTMTYTEVAKAIGRPRAYRAVGNVLNKNHDLNVPCHRVIRNDGKIGGYNRGGKLKQKLLHQEGAI
ncbi:MAG: MGMT family protein [Candidatus Yanofskybacteria bacterium]|nr:MGMT family protein [Candidatus Yanofskybacteria bacterium]